MSVDFHHMRVLLEHSLKSAERAEKYVLHMKHGHSAKDASHAIHDLKVTVAGLKKMKAALIRAG